MPKILKEIFKYFGSEELAKKKSAAKKTAKKASKKKPTSGNRNLIVIAGFMLLVPFRPMPHVIEKRIMLKMELLPSQ